MDGKLEYTGHRSIRVYKTVRVRGKKRDECKPGAHRCPECGGRLRQGGGNYVECERCHDTFDCDWNGHIPSVCADKEAYKAAAKQA